MNFSFNYIHAKPLYFFSAWHSPTTASASTQWTSMVWWPRYKAVTKVAAELRHPISSPPRPTLLACSPGNPRALRASGARECLSGSRERNSRGQLLNFQAALCRVVVDLFLEDKENERHSNKCLQNCFSPVFVGLFSCQQNEQHLNWLEFWDFLCSCDTDSLKFACLLAY